MGEASPDDVARSLSFALLYQGRKWGRDADTMMADIVAKRLVQHLRLSGGMMHLNHSCEPNLGLQGRVVYVALRDIGVGEELTSDYAMTDDEPYEMICRCGRPSCRGTITGFDWRKPEIQAKYAAYFSWFIQRRIDHLRKPANKAMTGPAPN